MPLTVIIDSEGRNLYEEGRAEYLKNRKNNFPYCEQGAERFRPCMIHTENTTAVPSVFRRIHGAQEKRKIILTVHKHIKERPVQRNIFF